MIQAVDGVVARLLADSALVGLVGRDRSGDVRITVGWPWEMLDRGDARDSLPLVTVLQVSDHTRRPGVGHVILQVDLWVWPVGESGGFRRLAAMDDRVLAVLDEASWSEGGVQLYATTDGATDFPAGAGEPMRRSRTFEVRCTKPI